MSNKQQTALEWLYVKMFENKGRITKEEYEQAKEMEKEQMIKFTDDFWFYCVNRDGSIKITPEQYYNETYGGN